MPFIVGTAKLASRTEDFSKCSLAFFRLFYCAIDEHLMMQTGDVCALAHLAEHLSGQLRVLGRL